jgi:hypothetical protein
MANDNQVKATCTFVVQDVLAMFDVTEDEAEEFLITITKCIEERMCERGWAVIEDLGCAEGLKLRDTYCVNAEPGKEEH